MSSQDIRYTSFIPASENDHSNFRIYTLSLPTGSLVVIKRGVYKSSLFIFHRVLYSILSDISLSIPVGWWGGGGGSGYKPLTCALIIQYFFFLSADNLTSEEDIRWDSGITSGEGG